MANLSKLPKVSEAFLAHIKERTLEKNEWMPCPRCGEGTVEPPSGALAGGIAGGLSIGCWVMLIIVIAIIVAIIFWPIAVFVVIFGLIMIPLLPVLGAGLGMLYRCKSCRYNWTFKDVQDYKNRGSRPLQH